jgi:hypothetical protein
MTFNEVWPWVLLAGAMVLVVRFVRRRGNTPKATTPVEKVRNTFSEWFPTWAYTHAQQLLDSLPSIATGAAKRQTLLDCLAGAHTVYLTLALPREMIELLGGGDRLVTGIVSWPEEAKSFFVMASEFIRPRMEKKDYDHDLVFSLKLLHESDNSDKPYEPIAVYLAQLTMKWLGYAELDLAVMSSLYDVFFRLQDEQLRWLSEEVLV